MQRAAFLVGGLIVASTSLACVQSSAFRFTSDRADRSEQRVEVRELAAQADAIYVAKATRAEMSSDTADFEIDHAIKGAKSASEHVTFEVPGEIIVGGCTVAAGFRNVILEPGHTYVVYVVRGKLIRAGEKKSRKWPELSWGDEIRLIRKTLAPNNALDQARGR